jgi:hypothetical protein
MPFEAAMSSEDATDTVPAAPVAPWRVAMPTAAAPVMFLLFAFRSV